MPGRAVLARLGSGAGLVLLGLFIGSVVAIQHRALSPFGLIAGMAILVAFAASLRVLRRGRLGLGLGMGAAFLAMMALSTELGQGYVVLADPLGWSLLGGTVLVFLGALAWPDLRRVSRYDGDSKPQKAQIPQ